MVSITDYPNIRWVFNDATSKRWTFRYSNTNQRGARLRSVEDW
ncbi:hypothetical protein SAMN03159297_02631 [Pseudomonas sp. NFACC45]|nr:hypothetical protein SAMN03159297_02631 [Pseudomonas sp. NFACC45]